MTSNPEFDGCQIVRKLRQGPIADVYHAIQQPLGRPVLIKALSASILPASPFAATLEREARLLAELHHPNILHVHDFVQSGDRLWLVLEFVDGWTLEELVEREVRLPPMAVAAIALEVARALDHAHQHAVIHRDVRPSNIMVSRKGRVKLLNFAVAVDERLPTAPELLDGVTASGSAVYMSPEQILGEPPDPRSDLFSLGIVIYELLSHELPFPDTEGRSATQSIRHDPPPPLSRKAPDVPPALDRIVHRCLEKLPSDRFGSSAELVAALQETLDAAGVRSRPRVIGEALMAAGLVDTALEGEPEPVASVIPSTQSRSLGPALRGLLLSFALIVIGGGVIQYQVYGQGARTHARHTHNRLELVPGRVAHLRVVATPWAHVSVDGERVETTPFAHPIPLEAGVHYVRLDHPHAPTERRTVELVPGETILLDVKMNVDAAALAEAAPSAEPNSGAPGPNAGPNAGPSAGRNAGPAASADDSP